MSMVEISCVEVWREISNYVDAAIDPELRARMEAHFKVCAHCTAVLDGTRNVVKLLAHGVEYDLPQGFGQRLYSKLKVYVQAGAAASWFRRIGRRFWPFLSVLQVPDASANQSANHPTCSR
jgi:Putative zinc-finger